MVHFVFIVKCFDASLAVDGTQFLGRWCWTAKAQFCSPQILLPKNWHTWLWSSQVKFWAMSVNDWVSCRSARLSLPSVYRLMFSSSLIFLAASTLELWDEKKKHCLLSLLRFQLINRSLEGIYFVPDACGPQLTRSKHSRAAKSYIIFRVFRQNINHKAYIWQPNNS